MKTDYEKLELEIIQFDCEDVIVTSETVPSESTDDYGPKIT